ncbi:hypothetical protein GF336_07125 [Candidatus Woesearchaeota archaeon]|nr:hypothetical protein [Candidatus Woesearchaeota archaeon]
MGLLDKIMFWKHDDEELPSAAPPLGLEKDNLGLGIDQQSAGAGAAPSIPQTQEFERPGVSTPSQFQQQQYPQQQPRQQFQQQYPQQQVSSKDMELISAKLDALKSALDSMNQRLANLERIARTSSYE